MNSDSLFTDNFQCRIIIRTAFNLTAMNIFQAFSGQRFVFGELVLYGMGSLIPYPTLLLYPGSRPTVSPEGLQAKLFFKQFFLIFKLTFQCLFAFFKIITSRRVSSIFFPLYLLHFIFRNLNETGQDRPPITSSVNSFRERQKRILRKQNTISDLSCRNQITNTNQDYGKLIL